MTKENGTFNAREFNRQFRHPPAHYWVLEPSDSRPSKRLKGTCKRDGCGQVKTFARTIEGSTNYRTPVIRRMEAKIFQEALLYSLAEHPAKN